MSALACACALTLSATACAPSEPKPTPTPTKTAIFASEEEALQAAVDVYQQFNAVIDLVDSSGESHFPEMTKFVTEDFYEKFSEAISLEDDGKHSKGSSTFRNSQLVSLDQSDKEVELSIALCRDLSQVKVLDTHDKDVTKESRKMDLVPLEVTFTWDPDKQKLLISGLSTWQDFAIC